MGGIEKKGEEPIDEITKKGGWRGIIKEKKEGSVTVNFSHAN